MLDTIYRYRISGKTSLENLVGASAYPRHHMDDAKYSSAREMSMAFGSNGTLGEAVKLITTRESPTTSSCWPKLGLCREHAC
eukprot:4431437-Amphidinium_carterae.1